MSCRSDILRASLSRGVSLSFLKGVGQGGEDLYEVKFEHGITAWRILLDADGKIDSVGFRPQ
jgi:hypothetical protein